MTCVGDEQHSEELVGMALGTTMQPLDSDREEFVRPDARSQVAYLLRHGFNQTTAKGLALIVGGLVLLLVPDLNAILLRWVFGTGLTLLGLFGIFSSIRRSKGGFALFSFTESVVALIGGILLLLFPTESVDVFASVLALYLLIAAIGAFIRGLRTSGERQTSFLRAGAMLAIALIAILTPSSLVSFTFVVLAVGALVLGSIIVGFSVRGQFDSRYEAIDPVSVFGAISGWFDSLDVGDRRRTDIGETLFFESPDLAGKLLAWWVMLVLSVTIATFGVLQDSTAVVIGAMIVAPLMVPILGSAAAVVNVRPRRFASSMFMVASGTVGAIVLAMIIATWTPFVVPLDTNSQITSRINPNVIDMGIALAAGAAGAFATVNRRVASSIAGVAIAVALVPPLAVVGINLQAGLLSDAWGALLLFLTNLVSIQLSAIVVLLLTGYTSRERLQSNREGIIGAFGTLLAVMLIILVPLTLAVQSALTSAQRSSTASKITQDWLDTSPDPEQLDLDSLAVDGDSVKIRVSGSTQLPSVQALGEQMQDALGEGTTTTVEFTPALTTVYDSDGNIQRFEAPFEVGPDGEVTTDDLPLSEPSPAQETSPSPSQDPTPSRPADREAGDGPSPGPEASPSP